MSSVDIYSDNIILSIYCENISCYIIMISYIELTDMIPKYKIFNLYYNFVCRCDIFPF